MCAVRVERIYQLPFLSKNFPTKESSKFRDRDENPNPQDRHCVWEDRRDTVSELSRLIKDVNQGWWGGWACGCAGGEEEPGGEAMWWRGEVGSGGVLMLAAFHDPSVTLVMGDDNSAGHTNHTICLLRPRGGIRRVLISGTVCITMSTFSQLPLSSKKIPFPSSKFGGGGSLRSRRRKRVDLFRRKRQLRKC